MFIIYIYFFFSYFLAFFRRFFNFHPGYNLKEFDKVHFCYFRRSKISDLKVLFLQRFNWGDDFVPLLVLQLHH